MGVIREQIKGAELIRDQQRPWRVYGAVGEGASSWALRPGLPCDATTGDPHEFVVTVTEVGGGGDSTMAVGQSAGYPLKLTTDNANYDGINAQLRGESVILDADTDARLRAKVKASEASTSDLLIGLCELKTDLLATGTAHAVTATSVEGVFFVKLSGAATLYVKSYKNGAQQTSVEVGAIGTTDIDLALWWDGANVRAYVNDVEVARFAGTLPDGALTPSINFRTGATTAITLDVAEFAYAAVTE